jgi:phosphoserine phosphatase
MNGDVKFEDALRDRLDIIRPTEEQLRRCTEAHPLVLSPHVSTLISFLRQRKADIFLISGGFIQLIEPLLATLEIPKDHVYANVLEFNEKGEYAGFDTLQPTSHSGGKAEALQAIIQTYGYKRVVMVGDGVTDMEAKPPAFMFIGYGGVTAREKVRLGADYFITDFRSLLC